MNSNKYNEQFLTILSDMHNIQSLTEYRIEKWR